MSTSGADFMAPRLGEVSARLRQLAAVCRDDDALKVILENSAQQLDTVQRTVARVLGEQEWRKVVDEKPPSGVPVLFRYPMVDWPEVRIFESWGKVGMMKNPLTGRFITADYETLEWRPI